ncbi:serine/threonine-protein kinase [Actinoplanes sp. NPDC049802]|uniref:serine/threonine-protein kinase n=1 Tax=Actinoplanes sp. NPDC049802 TaxID=3154742 RepID=UPI0033C8B20A
MPHERGDVIAGRYRLDDPIASGGMGEVWRATDTVLARPVAVKTLRADRAVDPQFQTRFRHEARAMAALHHPGIADVYDFGEDDGNGAYLVMARVDGQPLDRRIAERGRLTTAETMPIVAQVARALQAAHDAGIVHRDVKPGNLIIQPDGTVVLVDFGIARSSESAALTGAGEVVGTAHYIAPEQVVKRAVGPPADLYALGAVAYHCLAGHPPFLGDNMVTVAMRHLHDVPPPLPADVAPRARALVDTALAKDPAERFRSAAAMAAAADGALGGDPGGDVTAVVPLTPPLRTGYATAPDGSPDRDDRRYLIAVLSALLVLLGAGAALALADPFGWFPGTPAPSSSPASTPAPSVTTTGERTSPPADGSPSPSRARPSPSPSRTTSPSPSRTSPSTSPPTTSPTPPPPSSPAAGASGEAP